MRPGSPRVPPAHADIALQFKFPWLLTSLHATFASVGTGSLLKAGYFKLSHLGRKEHAILAAFSVLFTANIAVSNLSL